eukprot:scaffold3118_cov128-Isochrysis_galbana.AAC.2
MKRACAFGSAAFGSGVRAAACTRRCSSLSSFLYSRTDRPSSAAMRTASSSMDGSDLWVKIVAESDLVLSDALFLSGLTTGKGKAPSRFPSSAASLVSKVTALPAAAGSPASALAAGLAAAVAAPAPAPAPAPDKIAPAGPPQPGG